MKTIKEIKTYTHESYINGYEECRKDVLEFIDDEFDELPVRYNFIRLILKKRIKGE